jgi:hypothetical protein
MSWNPRPTARTRKRRNPVEPVGDAHSAGMMATTQEPCPHCDPYGRVDGKTCPHCRGIGELPRVKGPRP